MRFIPDIRKEAEGRMGEKEENQKRYISIRERREMRDICLRLCHLGSGLGLGLFIDFILYVHVHIPSLFNYSLISTLCQPIQFNPVQFSLIQSSQVQPSVTFDHPLYLHPVHSV